MCWFFLSCLGYRRTQGQPPSFFLGALGGLGGSSCSWYFLWEDASEFGLQGLGTRTTGRGLLRSPDSPHQLFKGLVYIEPQFGRGLEVGHVVGGTEGEGVRSGDLWGHRGESQVFALRGVPVWVGCRKTVLDRELHIMGAQAERESSREMVRWTPRGVGSI